MLERRTGEKLTYLRCDNGKEFVDERLQGPLTKMGVKMEFTSPYSPQSNGVAERCNRTIAEKARAMLMLAGMPKFMWGSAALLANLLRNVSPVANHAKTPWELFNKREPDLSMLKVFGSMAYVNIPRTNNTLKGDKMSERAVRGVLVGVDLRAKQYHVYIDGRIGCYRDVTVDERVRAWAELCPAELDEEQDFAAWCDNLLVRTAAFDQEQSDSQKQNTDNDHHAVDTGLDTYSSDEDDDDTGTSGVAVRGSDEQRRVRFALPDAEEDTGPGGARLSGNSAVSLEQDAAQNDGAQAELEAAAADAGDGASDAPHRYPTRFAARTKLNYLVCALSPHAPVKSRHPVPKTWTEAMRSPVSRLWKAAADKEMDAIAAFGTYELVPRPTGTGAIVLPNSWVFREKLNPDGTVSQMKARLVVGGHRQREGVDYNEIYAPVSQYTTLRVLLAVAAVHNLELMCMDISNACLHGTLEETVYMQEPKGYETSNGELVCRLRRTLYVLKQSPREWYKALTAALADMGFARSTSDQGLWLAQVLGASVFVLLYVDDIIVAGAAADSCREVVTDLLRRFKGKDLGDVATYLNMVITRDRQQSSLSILQPQHIRKLLQVFGMEDCKPKPVPISQGSDTSARKPEEAALPQREASLYAEGVGMLMYIANVSRPDLMYAASVMAKHMSNSTERHLNLLKGVLRYLSGTAGLQLRYGGGEGTNSDSSSVAVSAELRPYLHGFSDSDYAACADTRRSRTGWMFKVSGGAVAWQSKQQQVVAQSTAEAEYVSLNSASNQAGWMKTLLHELQYSREGPVVLFGDNQAAIKMAEGTDSVRTKHIDVKYHAIRDDIARGRTALEYVSTEHNIADIFTKPLGEVVFCRLRKLLGLW